MYFKRYSYIAAAAAFILLFCAPGSPMAANGATCDKYVEIAQEIVPKQIGEASYVNGLLQVPDGRDWMAEFPDNCMKEILDDNSLEKLNINETQVGVCRGEAAILRYNKPAGEVKYANRTRSFMYGQSPRQAVSDSKGVETIIPFLQKINMPLTEWNLKVYNTVVLMGAVGPVEGARAANAEETFEAERHYRFARAIGGYDGVPVLGSRFFAAISNNAEVARVRIQWPQFVIDPRVKEKSQVLSRDTVVNAVHDALVKANGQCEELRSYHAFVAYAPQKRDTASDNEGSRANSSLHLETIVYTPKLLVSVLPSSLEEAGMQFLVDILTVDGAETSDDEDDD
ncbi:MAG: hypothetical protein GY859_04690 [Desulfobacterales bacterium]|nr:hypothetical protein [Desulfobacterales bacterium]